MFSGVHIDLEVLLGQDLTDHEIDHDQERAEEETVDILFYLLLKTLFLTLSTLFIWYVSFCRVFVYFLLYIHVYDNKLICHFYVMINYINKLVLDLSGM